MQILAENENYVLFIDDIYQYGITNKRTSQPMIFQENEFYMLVDLIDSWKEVGENNNDNP